MKENERWVVRLHLTKIQRKASDYGMVARVRGDRPPRLLHFTVGDPFLVAHALVQDLPDQSTQSVADGPNRLGMSEAWDDPTVDDGKNRPLGLHRGVGGLVEDTSHLPVAFGAAVVVVHAGTLLVTGAGAHPRGEML